MKRWMPLRKQWHASLTDEVIVAAVKRRMTDLDNPGFCLMCGTEHEGVEPDARYYRCESANCGAELVFGADELLMFLDAMDVSDDRMRRARGWIG